MGLMVIGIDFWNLSAAARRFTVTSSWIAYFFLSKREKKKIDK